MIDFVKVELPKGIKVQKNALFEFYGKHSVATGEVLDELQAKAMGISVDEKRTHTLISFSVHKVYNLLKDGVYNNSGRFPINKLIWVLNKISQILSIPLNKAKIRTIEFGINFRSSSAIEFKNLISHWGIPFSEMRLDRNGQLFGVNCYHSHYGIKFYNKALQLGLKEREYRFEIKVKKMQFLNSILTESKHFPAFRRILTLADLLSLRVLCYLKSELIRVFKDILFYENPDNFDDTMCRDDVEFLLKASNPHFWATRKWTYKVRKQNTIKYRRLAINANRQSKKLSQLLENELVEVFNSSHLRSISESVPFYPLVVRYKFSGEKRQCILSLEPNKPP